MSLAKLFTRIKLPTLLAVTPFLFAYSTPAHAELKLPQTSPRASVSHRIGVTDVSVGYSSPSVRGRSIWGELVPYGELWRAGANACTKVTFSDDVTALGKDLSAGAYCLFFIPNKEKWTVIFNSDASLSGTEGYNAEQDVLRAEITPFEVTPRENLTYFFTDVKEDSGNLRLEWDTLGVSIPIAAETKQLALQNIKLLQSNQWRDYANAARYLLEEEQEPQLAMKLVEQSIALQKTWFNTWVKAQLLAAAGNVQEAAKEARAAKELGDGSNFFKAYQPRIDRAIAEWE